VVREHSSLDQNQITDENTNDVSKIYTHLYTSAVSLLMLLRHFLRKNLYYLRNLINIIPFILVMRSLIILLFLTAAREAKKFTLINGNVDVDYNDNNKLLILNVTKNGKYDILFKNVL